ncbi:hypothetical protein JCM11491_000719, partial [Sporobolomyces phaffii]
MSDSKHAAAPPGRTPSRWRWREAVALIVLAAFACSSWLSSVSSPLDLVLDTWARLGPLSNDPRHRALQLAQRYPVIDGHIDLPILSRYIYANQIDDFDLNRPTKGEVDIPRLRTGHVGGFFWSVFVPCPDRDSHNFTNPSYRVRDTLEQIDVARLLIDRYSD